MSLDPKTIYFTQRTADGSNWQEVYISGSNLFIQTDADGILTGSADITALSASYALTASYVMAGNFSGSIDSASYANYATSASYASTASYVSGYAISGSVNSASYASYAVSSSYASTASYSSYAISSSNSITSSYSRYAISSSNAITSSYSRYAISSSYAVTSSYALKAESLVSGININVGKVTASAMLVQNLNVVYITSSVVIATGSNKFGDDMSDTHQFTGSVLITGSLNVTGSIYGDGSKLKNIGAVDKVFYVSEQGLDTNDGKTLSTSFRTIKAAAVAASASAALYGNGITPYRMSIHIKSGYYTEVAPITLPSWTSIIGDDLRTTVVRPTSGTKGENMFLVNNGCYAYNLRFEGAEIDNLENPRKGFFFAFASGAFITTSPYIQNCSCIHTPFDKFYVPLDSGSNPPNPLVGNGPGGMIVDDSVLDGYSPLRSMIVDAYTQVAFNGIGLCVRGRGYAQQVSFFTNFSRVGIFAMDGGHASLLNSNTTFGDYGLRASGSRILVVPDISNISSSIDATACALIKANTGSIQNYMMTNLQTYGWYSSSYLDTNSAAYKSTIKDSGLLLTSIAEDLLVAKAARTSTFLQGQFKGQDTSNDLRYTLPSASVDFRKGAIAAFRVNDGKKMAMDYTSSYKFIKSYIINDPDALFTTMTTPAKNKIGQMLDLAVDVIRSVAINVEPTYLQEFGSLITSTSHDLSYAGSGVNFLGLPVNQGGIGQTNYDIRIYEEAGGRVFHTSGDETGDFFAGIDFVIRQSTGTIEGRTFNKAIAARVVPLNLALESV
jgi:hypothetical protein